MSAAVRFTLLSLVLLVSASPVVGHDDDSLERLERLEREVEALKKARAAEPSDPNADHEHAPPEHDEPFEHLRLGWGKKGFELLYVDPDGVGGDETIHKMGVHGKAQLDYRWHTDGDHPTEDQALFRRADLGVEGFFFKEVGYAFAYDFSKDALSRVNVGWINLGFLPAAQLRLGFDKQPFMLEALISSRFSNFNERPLSKVALAVDKELGAWVHGKSSLVNYKMGVSTGVAGNRRDDNSQKDVSARVQLTPFTGGTGLVKDVGIAGSFTSGQADRFLPVFTTNGGTVWLPFDRDNDDQHGNRLRAGAELVLGGGPLRFQTEYLYMRVADLTDSASGIADDVSVHAFYVDLLYMLTGEDHPIGKRVRPAQNFSLREGGWGAWQIGARFEIIDVESDFARLLAANPAGDDGAQLGGTDVMTSVTIGLNWWLNPHTRFMASYQRFWFDDRISDQREDRHVKKNEDLVFFRLQVDF